MTNIMITVLTTLFALIVLMANQGAVQGFEMTFPVGPSGASYWVSCKENVLQWSSNSTDPTIFSVALYNENSTKLNGNYQIANSVPTVNGTVKVRPNCVEPGSGYFVGFVNSSQYSLNHPQIYYTSPTFTIQPNSTQIPPTPSNQPTTGDVGTQTETQAPTFGPANAGQQTGTNSSTVNSGESKGNGVMAVQVSRLQVYLGIVLVCTTLSVLT